MDPDLQGRISHASDIDEIEAIAKQSGFSVSTSDLEDWYDDHDESSDGFKEDLHMAIQLYKWRRIGKNCDPEWMQDAKRRERRRMLGLD